MPPSDDTSRAIDDAGIKGGSPIDRVIGMLLERTEAVRELHDNMRADFRAFTEAQSELRALSSRLTDRQESHEQLDRQQFEQIRTGVASIDTKFDSFKTAFDAKLDAKIGTIQSLIGDATTAGLIQKAQISAGWKVITVIGAIALAAISIFAIFYNHKA